MGNRLVLPKLWTARYSNPVLATHPAAKVQTSLGAPKFPLPYQLAAAIAYGHQLDRLGGDRVRRSLDQVARTAGVDQLALLCFEDVRQPGVWCHRRLIASIWQEQTGEAVEELAEPLEQLAFGERL